MMAAMVGDRRLIVLRLGRTWRDDPPEEGGAARMLMMDESNSDELRGYEKTVRQQESHIVSRRGCRDWY